MGILACQFSWGVGREDGLLPAPKLVFLLHLELQGRLILRLTMTFLFFYFFISYVFYFWLKYMHAACAMAYKNLVSKQS